MNELFTIEPDALAYGGRAVGTLPSGKRCFIPGGAPGDTLEVRVTADRKSFAEARIERVVRPSEMRIGPQCPYAGICPGCAYQHVAYECELAWKQKQFERFLVHPGLVKSVEPPVPAPQRLFWRNKLKLTCENGKKGYLGEDNRSLVPVTDCLLARKELAGFAFSDSVPDSPDRSQVTYRCTEKDGAFRVGDPFRIVTEEIPGHGTFQVPAGSFFQVNREAFALLADSFVRLVKPHSFDSFTEFYCGSGVFSRLAAECGIPEICGIESDPEAVNTASKNVPGAKFIAMDSGKAARRIRPDAGRSLILADPPRTGLDDAARHALARAKADAFLYVSCGPDTLQRDLREFVSCGWKIASSRLFDLFPATAHFESMTLLLREPAHD